MKYITSFSGEYRFLSNFYAARCEYKTAEHYYQAAKTTNISDYTKIIECETPGQAKRMAKTIQIRSDWDNIKLVVMEQLLIKKFSNYDLACMLLQTGDAVIIEGNTWGDTFWGVCNGVGHNHLGNILMKIRDEFLDVRALVTY